MLLVAAPALAPAQALSEREWKVDGAARKGLVHVPAEARKTETPLVFVFHGHGGTMANAARSFALHKRWPEALVVYLQGLNTPGKLTDPDGKKPGWQRGPGDQGDRDLKLFDTVLASLKSEFKVDTKRTYVTGHSNGGAFTYLLWAQRGDVFAAVAPSAAVPNRAWFKGVPPLPALHVAGEKDALVKYEWQQIAIDAVRKVNGCDAKGKDWAKAGSLAGTEYRSRSGAPLVTLIGPGGHAFPTEAPELIVRFFKEHRRK